MLPPSPGITTHREQSLHRRREWLERPHCSSAGPAGLFRQTTPSPEVRRLHTALNLALPPRILDLDPQPLTTP
ncbi:hypothetical protein GCM10009613_25710 [Pseudonocardia kongjuensis]|uniref:Uncharacterized protein n=1 Tax=Pseudonocardia kongjuensis TaxID=102227 RepID=A0ABP4IJU4_9PSEU